MARPEKSRFGVSGRRPTRPRGEERVRAEAESGPYEGEDRLQYAALPYRLTQNGEVEVLLVTSRRTRRWIIPKGWPIKGLRPEGSAAQEAFEEAGILGKVDGRPVGTYTYQKRLKETSGVVSCKVHVFQLRVEREMAVWPETGQRELRWLASNDAADLVSDAGLKAIIRRVYCT